MAFSGALINKAANQTSANFSSAAAITWDTEQYDVGTWHDTGSNTSRLTVPSGVTHVRLSARVSVDALTNGALCYIWIAKNGQTTFPTRHVSLPHRAAYMSSGGIHTTLVSGPLAVTPGDWFEVFLHIPTDSSTTIIGGTDSSWFAIEAIENFSGAMVTKSADATAVDSSAGAVITWNTDTLDIGGWHDTGSDTERLTVPSGVNYVRVTGCIDIRSITAGTQGLVWVTKNGDNDVATRYINLPTITDQLAGATTLEMNFASGPLAVTPGDYFAVHFQSADTSVTIEDYSWFAIEKLG
jgi:hypothetical protein